MVHGPASKREVYHFTCRVSINPEVGSHPRRAPRRRRCPHTHFPGTGLFKDDRDTTISRLGILRIGWVAQLLTKHGISSLAAAILPHPKIRRSVGALAEADRMVRENLEIKALVQAG